MRDQVYVPRVSLIYNGPSDNWGDIKSFQNDDGSGVYINFLYNEAWSNKIALREISTRSYISMGSNSYTFGIMVNVFVFELIKRLETA